MVDQQAGNGVRLHVVTTGAPTEPVPCLGTYTCLCIPCVIDRGMRVDEAARKAA